MRLFASSMFALMNLRAAMGGLRAGVAESESRDKSEEGRERRESGYRGELLAYWYLRREGYVVIRRNFRSAAGGEIDLIGWDGPVLAFVEVKTRIAGSVNAPEAAVHGEKRELLRRTALSYLRRRDWDDVQYRFDIVAIESPGGGRLKFPVIRLHKAAFGG